LGVAQVEELLVEKKAFQCFSYKNRYGQSVLLDELIPPFYIFADDPGEVIGICPELEPSNDLDLPVY
jgi:hypothetical protein